MAQAHKFGQAHFLPAGVPLFRVECWRGHYVATYTSEAEARQHARALDGYRDAKVIPLSIARH